MELVSAVITTHNRKQLLVEAIQSVQQQTYPNIELIVVDDASDDGTRELCENKGFTYIYIPKEESRGGNHARNVGILNAKGTYVAFLDDDDRWLPDKIAKQVKLIESGDFELVHCGKYVEKIGTNGQAITKELLPSSMDGGDLSRRILYRISCTTTNILVKRQALLDVGLFDENIRFWQEYELCIRLAQRKEFTFVNEPLSIYRVDINDNKRLTNKYYEWKNTVRQIYDKHKHLYQKLNRMELIRVRALYLFDAAYRCKNAGLLGLASLKYAQWMILNGFLKVCDNQNK